ncbi:MAG TPA: PDZ domain-containing protein [Chthoniobacter sp.]
MKTLFSSLLAALFAAVTCAAFAQDAPKPPAPERPAPDATAPPGPPAPPTPPPPPEGRHGEHHHSEGWHHSPGPWGMPIPTKPTSYIGVITTPPPGVLTAQLGLSEGFGLVVSDVLPDSPAAVAGIQRYDVLTKFNDQQLVDSSQFAALVRALKKDAEATVTLIRKAAEQTVTVKIGERMLPERSHGFPMPGNFRSGGPVFPPGEYERSGEYSRHLEDETRRFQERAQMYSQKMHDYQERMKVWQKNPSAEMPKLPDLPPTEAVTVVPNPSAVETSPSIAPEDILREVRPGGAAQIRVVQPNALVTYNVANAKLVMKDDTGEIELATRDGKRTLAARNAKGETIFDGPIDTEEQRKALPEDVRKKLEVIEQQRKLAETLPPLQGPPIFDLDVQ